MGSSREKAQNIKAAISVVKVMTKPAKLSLHTCFSWPSKSREPSILQNAYCGFRFVGFRVSKTLLARVFAHMPMFLYFYILPYLCIGRQSKSGPFS